MFRLISVWFSLQSDCKLLPLILIEAYNTSESENSNIFSLPTECKSLSKSHITMKVICRQLLGFVGICNSHKWPPSQFLLNSRSDRFLRRSPSVNGICLSCAFLSAFSCCRNMSAGGPEPRAERNGIKAWFARHGISNLIYKTRLSREERDKAAPWEVNSDIRTLLKIVRILRAQTWWTDFNLNSSPSPASPTWPLQVAVPDGAHSEVHLLLSMSLSVFILTILFKYSVPTMKSIHSSV